MAQPLNSHRIGITIRGNRSEATKAAIKGKVVGFRFASLALSDRRSAGALKQMTAGRKRPYGFSVTWTKSRMICPSFLPGGPKVG